MFRVRPACLRPITLVRRFTWSLWRPRRCDWKTCRAASGYLDRTVVWPGLAARYGLFHACEPSAGRHGFGSGRHVSSGRWRGRRDQRTRQRRGVEFQPRDAGCSRIVSEHTGERQQRHRYLHAKQWRTLSAAGCGGFRLGWNRWVGAIRLSAVFRARPCHTSTSSSTDRPTR
jgi:hypothetical protein